MERRATGDSEMGDQTSEVEDLERVFTDSTAEPIKISYTAIKHITKNFAEVIGNGGFGVVYLGGLRNGMVAVKKLSTSKDFSDKPFLDEVKCLKRIKHKNTVRFLGYCADTQGEVMEVEGKLRIVEVQRRLLCFEYVPNGSLYQYLKEKSHGYEWNVRYKIIKGICQGLHYLHQERINHLDIKPANVLLAAYMEPKITDFGVSRCIDKEQSTVVTKNFFGTLGYVAPEFIDKQQISFKSDVFSLGVIMVNLLTGCNGSIINNWHETIDVDCPQMKRCIEIAQICIDRDPQKRPTMGEIIRDLNETETMIQKYSPTINEPRNDPGSLLYQVVHRFQAMSIRPFCESSRLDDLYTELNFLEAILEGREKPSNLPYQLLQFITENFSDKRVMIQTGSGEIYKCILRSVAVRRFPRSRTRFFIEGQNASVLCRNFFISFPCENKQYVCSGFSSVSKGMETAPRPNIWSSQGKNKLDLVSRVSSLALASLAKVVGMALCPNISGSSQGKSKLDVGSWVGSLASLKSMEMAPRLNISGSSHDFSKTLDNILVKMDDRMFHQEVERMKTVQHQNIIRFLGYCSYTEEKPFEIEGKTAMAETRERLLCFEHLSNGSLASYLSDPSRGLEWRERYQIIKGICEGVHYLHTERIAHLDLKPANVLLDDNMVPKISGFSVSRCLDEKQNQLFQISYYDIIKARTCIRRDYTAPEFSSSQICPTLKMDIFSLGVMILEILTGVKTDSTIENVVQSWRTRLGLGTSSSTEPVLEQVRVCAALSMACMEEDPAKRPDTQRIIEMLDRAECDAKTRMSVVSVISTAQEEKACNELWRSTQKCPDEQALHKAPSGMEDSQRNFMGTSFLCFDDVTHRLERRNQAYRSSRKSRVPSQNVEIKKSTPTQSVHRKLDNPFVCERENGGGAEAREVGRSHGTRPCQGHKTQLHGRRYNCRIEDNAAPSSSHQELLLVQDAATGGRKKAAEHLCGEDEQELPAAAAAGGKSQQNINVQERKIAVNG